MRIFVMAILLLGVVGCGSIYENNPEYPALKLLKTDRDSATGQVRATVLLMRTPYTKKFYFETYSQYVNNQYSRRPAFIFKSVVQFRLNENIGSFPLRNSSYSSKGISFLLNRNLLFFDDTVDEDRWQLLQDFPEKSEYSFLLRPHELDKKIGLVLYPQVNNAIDFKHSITIWTDEIPRIK